MAQDSEPGPGLTFIKIEEIDVQPDNIKTEAIGSEDDESTIIEEDALKSTDISCMKKETSWIDITINNTIKYEESGSNVESTDKEGDMVWRPGTSTNKIDTVASMETDYDEVPLVSLKTEPANTCQEPGRSATMGEATHETDGNSCNTLDYKTNKQYIYRDSIKATHNIPFPCDKSDYKYYITLNLNKPLITKVGEKKFCCDMCDYKSNTKYHLKYHIMTHTGEKNFFCDKCDYKCIHKSDFKRHLMAHTGEKKFSCDKCDYKCNTKYYFKHHLMTHTDERNFSCDKCDYKCNFKSSLNRHLMTHTGEKKFSCDKCDYKCIQKTHLTHHLMTHTGEKKFSCHVCDYKCIEKRNLNRHLLKHANGK